MARLELRWRNNPKHASRDTRRNDFLNFLVDGHSLHDSVGARDRVTSLGGWFPNRLFEAVYLRGLLLLHPPYLESERYELYVCPLCGDVGCGSITADIQSDGHRVIWRDFAYEVNYWFDDPSEMLIRDDYNHIGPFEFDRAQYEEALLSWPLRP